MQDLFTEQAWQLADLQSQYSSLQQENSQLQSERDELQSALDSLTATPEPTSASDISYTVEEAENGVIVTVTNNTDEVIDFDCIFVDFLDDDENVVAEGICQFYWIPAHGERISAAVFNNGAEYSSWEVYNTRAGVLSYATGWENPEDFVLEPKAGGWEYVSEWGQIGLTITNNSSDYASNFAIFCAYYDADDNLISIDYFQSGGVGSGETDTYLSFGNIPDNFDHFETFVDYVMS